MDRTRVRARGAKHVRTDADDRACVRDPANEWLLDHSVTLTRAILLGRRAVVRYRIRAVRRAAPRLSAGWLVSARARQATNPSGRTRTAPERETS